MIEFRVVVLSTTDLKFWHIGLSVNLLLIISLSNQTVQKDRYWYLHGSRVWWICHVLAPFSYMVNNKKDNLLIYSWVMS